MAKKNSSKLIGLTGGIGSGKSTVAQSFANLGVNVVSADQFARFVTEKGSETLNLIAANFPANVLLADGSLNRTWLRTLITQDRAAKAKLEAITHPAIRKLAAAEIRRLEEEGSPIILYEIPLLFESANKYRLDAVIGVRAPDPLRIQRIMQRDGVDENSARAILRAQMPAEEKLKKCDYIIQNNGNLQELRQEVDKALEWINATVGAP